MHGKTHTSCQTTAQAVNPQQDFGCANLGHSPAQKRHTLGCRVENKTREQNGKKEAGNNDIISY